MDKNKLLDTDKNFKLSTPPSTWHPHVYGKPPNQPTPYSISDILGWKENDVKNDVCVNNEIIIASPKSILRDIKEKSWPQLLDNSNYKSSMSDVSEDETTTTLDQPLNLSITKPLMTIRKEEPTPVLGGKFNILYIIRYCITN